MNWIRGEAKRLSLLALFALAIQFGLSFGHIHTDPSWWTSHQQTVSSAFTPSPGNAQADDDGLCAICLTVAMVTSAAQAAPPALPTQTEFSSVAFIPEHISEHRLLRLAAFRSRAPPLA